MDRDVRIELATPRSAIWIPKNYALGPAIVGCFDVYVLVNSYDHVNDVEAVSSLHCNHTFFLGKLDLNWSTSTSCKYFPL